MRPQIMRKLAINTALASVFFALTYWMLTSGALADLNLPFIPDFTGK